MIKLTANFNKYIFSKELGKYKLNEQHSAYELETQNYIFKK